eukprot:jgi/Undpi1/5146/HiC_scaffold_19.g08497.m1
MLLPQPPKADLKVPSSIRVASAAESTLSGLFQDGGVCVVVGGWIPLGSPDSDTIPGFPTEGVRDFPASTSPSNSPILGGGVGVGRGPVGRIGGGEEEWGERGGAGSGAVGRDGADEVRRISLDDKAKVKAYSIENDKAGWLQKKLFKKEVAWPRELYLSVLACKAIVAPSQTQRCQAPASRCAESEATTASVTTEGEGDRESGGGGGGGAIESETVVSGVSERGRGGAIEFEPVTTDGVEGDGAGIAGQGGGADEEAALQGAAADTDAAAEDSEPKDVEGEQVGGGEGGGDGAASSDGEGKGWAERAGEFDEESAEDGEGSGVGCFVRIRNATTGRDLQTQVVEGSANPSFHETFVVPCQGPRDAVVLELHFGKGDQIVPIGEAALSLDARVVGASRPVLLSVKDKQGRSRGFLRVEAFWVDEAKPRKDIGEFYYRVVHPRGVSLRSRPSMAADRSVNVMEYGEVFVACERQWLVGDGECTVFVKVLTAKDRWARTGWCFETLCHGDEERKAVLERISPPKKETGRFFYRVSNAKGARLYSKPDAKSRLRKEVLPEGQVLESCEKWTPAGSSVTFVAVDNQRGYIVQKCGRKIVRDAAGTMALEEIDCPKSRVVSSVGVGLAGPRAVSPPGRARISRAHSTAGVTANAAGADVRNAAAAAATAATTSASEAAAAAAAVRRLYRVREAGGVQATRTPDIVAPTIDVIQAGTAFYGIAEVVKHYEGIGEVAFVMRETDKLWVRANRPGLSLLLDCFTDSVEAGAFTYRVSHENGVVVRTAPGLDAPPVKPRRILPVTKMVNVCERLTRAEDILTMSRPPIFLRLAGNDGWVFDRRGHTLVCEDVTVKARVATANAITAEAARLALS